LPIQLCGFSLAKEGVIFWWIGLLILLGGLTPLPQAGLISDVDPGAKVLGSPAQPRRDFFRQIATLKKMAKGEG
jgi:hypothetical protein